MPAKSKTVLRVGAASHRGIVRSENQDRISRFRCPLGEVFAVVDGMGGHLDGGRAAELALEVLERELSRFAAGAAVPEALRQAAEVANTELRRVSAEIDDGTGARMGATLVLAVVDGTRAVVAHAGDSRAYRAHGDRLDLLTRDHTLVQKLVDHNVISSEEARSHPDASVVTRALGQQESVEVEVGVPLELTPGDRLVLCSDGLSGYVDDTEIARVLAACMDVQEATGRLLELALAAGGEDNVSVQVIELEARAEKPRSAPAAAPATAKKPAGRGVWLWSVLGLVLAALAAAGLLGWLG